MCAKMRLWANEGCRVWDWAARLWKGGLAPAACVKHVSCYTRISALSPIFSALYRYCAPFSLLESPPKTFLRTKSCGADQLGPLHAPRAPRSWSIPCGARTEALTGSRPARGREAARAWSRTPMLFGWLAKAEVSSPLAHVFPPLGHICINTL